jgi:3-phosphoshikimate 1-carboxyvinyltransferase
VGGRAAVDGEALVIEGSDGPPVGRVVTAGDHRLAMAFAVLGTIPGAKVRIDDMQCADVSFPGFHTLLRSLQRGAGRG